MEKWSDLTRPLVTLLLIATACYLAIVGSIDAKDFISLVTIVVLFWFKERADSKANEATLTQLKTINEVKGTGNA